MMTVPGIALTPSHPTSLSDAMLSSTQPIHPSPSNPFSPPPPPSPQASSLDLAKAIAPSVYVTPTSTYSQPQIDYFLDIAMGSEYGNATPHIRKWDTNVRISVHGTPTLQDRESLEGIVEELNTLIAPLDLQILEDTAPDPAQHHEGLSPVEPANVNIHFVPYTEFSEYVPSYQPGNLGYAWIWWQNDTIYDATILISSVGINQTERSHLIREELTQSLGLLQDSYQYEDSIFFQLWTTTTQYSALDESLIRMLYSSKIQPGMTRQAVIATFADGAIATAAD